MSSVQVDKQSSFKPPIPYELMNYRSAYEKYPLPSSRQPKFQQVIKQNFSYLPSFTDVDEKYNTYYKFKLDSTMDQIIPRLFISDDIAARDKSLLLKNKITHVLNITVNIPNKYENEFVYMKLNIFDFENQNISQYFEEVYEFIDKALTENENNAVLCHCNAGISRSASFIIAYLMKKQIYPRYKDAYDHVKKCRPVISPNRGFVKQLCLLEQKTNVRKKKCSIM